MISSTMVGTGHLLPRILSNQPGCVCLLRLVVCAHSKRQERQLEGVGTEPLRLFRSVRRRREEAPKLLLASNLGAPAPPGCNGALAPLRRPGRPITTHPPMTCRPRPLHESKSQSTSRPRRPLPTNQGHKHDKVVGHRNPRPHFLATLPQFVGLFCLLFPLVIITK